MVKEWDKIDPEFNKWWDGDLDDKGNPYGKDTPAYWAWEGWKAAKNSLKVDETIYAWLEPSVKYPRICPEVGFDYTITTEHPANLNWIPLVKKLIYEVAPDVT